MEGDKLIAKFDGWKRVGSAGSSESLEDIPYYKKFDTNGKIIHDGVFHHPEYHDNWSSLMPVCKKIRNMFYGNKIDRKDYLAAMDNIEKALLFMGIDLVFEHTVNFIKLLNQNKKP